VVEILSQAPQALPLDSQDRVLIIITVIVAHVAFLVVVVLSDGLRDLPALANVRPESRA
jgi:hypothetical protein